MAATTGVMADFARMPTSRKAIVFGVIGLFLGLLYWRFVSTPLGERIAAEKAGLEANVRAQKKNADDIPKYKELRGEMAELQRTIEENQKALPTEAEVPAFFETLERKVRESGVEIQKWTKNKEEPVEQFVKVPVEIQMSGTFMQIKRFFASLVQGDVAAAVPIDGATEERERIVSIENLVLSKPEVRNREIFLTARFIAVTFRQEDNVAPAPTPNATGAKPGTGTPPAPAAPAPAATPSAPALPSSNTPAGAKANVDDSMQKSVDRNAAGAGSARLGGGL